MNALFYLIDTVIHLYIWALIIYAVMSWLVAFNVINFHNQFVRTVLDILYRITEPLLRPIRKVVPLINGIDLSPIILILILQVVRWFVIYDLRPALLY